MLLPKSAWHHLEELEYLKICPPRPQSLGQHSWIIKETKSKSCPKHMQRDPCLLLPHRFYNHLKEMCEKCLSEAVLKKKKTSVLLVSSESERETAKRSQHSD